MERYGGYMKLSLLLPTLGEREKELERLLDSLNIQVHTEFQVVIITQDNHEVIRQMITRYHALDILHVPINKRGLSYSRNIGLEYCDGSVVILSDDDCWYHRDSLKIINDEFTKDPNLDVLFTQIYDQENKALYKSNYARIVKNIKQKKELLSKSSIEIAFKKDSCTTRFDEVFGLGGVYNSGEEVDFLLNNFSKERTFKYIPRVTVYHPRKKGISDSGRVINRGALYAKNFSIVRSFIDVTKDLLFRKQNNFRLFFTGYFRYKYHF